MPQANCHACWAAWGTPNAVKLKGFGLALEADAIQYQPRVWDFFVGQVEWEKVELSI